MQVMLPEQLPAISVRQPSADLILRGDMSGDDNSDSKPTAMRFAPVIASAEPQEADTVRRPGPDRTTEGLSHRGCGSTSPAENESSGPLHNPMEAGVVFSVSVFRRISAVSPDCFVKLIPELKEISKMLTGLKNPCRLKTEC